MYFPTYQMDDKAWMIDGSIITNNPTLIGYSFAKKILETNNIKILRLGSGQNKNKIDAINRLESLFSDIKIPIKRIPTKPSWSSQVKRVQSKKKRSVLKRNRKKVMLDE